MNIVLQLYLGKTNVQLKNNHLKVPQLDLLV